jgi:hypothetical protein
MTDSTKRMWMWPLLVAAAIVIVRVVLEQLGAPESVNFVFGVVWLYFIVPFYFASLIAGSGVARPYFQLFKSLVMFSLYTRLMVLPTYWLAYAFQWTAIRFRLDAGGVVGEGVSPLQGLLIIPGLNAFTWIVFAVIVGMLLGGVMLYIRRRKLAQAAAAAELISLALFGSRFWW